MFEPVLSSGLVSWEEGEGGGQGWENIFEKLLFNTRQDEGFTDSFSLKIWIHIYEYIS